MGNVLLVSSTDKANELLESLLKSNGYNKITVALSSAEARRTVMHADFEIIVINAPLSDEVGTNLAISLTNTTDAGVLLIIKNDHVDDLRAKVHDYGVLVIPKPLNKTYFYQALKLVHAARNRLLKVLAENKKLKTKLEESRIINQAKCILIANLNMSENDAHKYIEKQAMDTRSTRKEVALDIIESYD